MKLQKLRFTEFIPSQTSAPMVSSPQSGLEEELVCLSCLILLYFILFLVAVNNTDMVVTTKLQYKQSWKYRLSLISHGEEPF